MNWVKTLAALMVVVSISQAKAERPNVLLILTDDQGWGDLGAHDNDIVKTPTLDGLATESVRLDRFYVSPVCAPTRAALLTGRYPERTGVVGVTRRQEVMRAEETTLAELFSAAGYATGCFGKWHNGAQMPLHPNGQGFDEFFGFCGGHFNLYDDPLLERNGRPVQTEGYITNLLTSAAMTFIAEHDGKKPWFCYVPYNAPHGPFQVDRKLFDKYNDGKISEKTAAVYAMVENIDTNVAWLLELIEQRNQSENTIVIFFTDNGPNGERYNGGMRGRKGSVHEGGCRVPCLIRWPKKIQPRKISQIAAHIDLLPTLAEWCELDMPNEDKLDGTSLAKLIRDGEDATLAERHIVTNRPHSKKPGELHRAAVRTNRFRLTIENGKTSLFDMNVDPSQKRDVAAKHPVVTRQLRTEILQYIEQTQSSIRQTRSVPIGGRDTTFVPSVDFTPQGDVGFADEISFAHSWIDRWVKPSDRITLPIDCLRPGEYEIVLQYVCHTAGAQVKATLGETSLSAALPKAAIDSVIRPDLDSKAKPRRMLEFRQQSLGVMMLQGGEATLVLQRSDRNGAELEFGGVTFRRVVD